MYTIITVEEYDIIELLVTHLALFHSGKEVCMSLTEFQVPNIIIDNNFLKKSFS